MKEKITPAATSDQDNNLSPPSASPASAAAASSAVPEAGREATPENTPVPGGGSWRWGGPVDKWVPNVPPGGETPSPEQSVA